ncbi:MAG: sigma 54-interacting transcriptional regulator [Bdellovibrionales bacterium]|nr:sigma 54-interacting transcriptional regulator [Bdellovibrionales bacterium]
MKRQAAGTIFLDEIGDLPVAVQPKLLRALEEQAARRLGETELRQFDVRLISATNQRLESMVERGDFRRDLFFRINVFPIELPPLRHRADDIPMLAAHFVSKWENTDVFLEEGALRKLSSHAFPGNVRELENIIRRALVLRQGNSITAGDIVISGDFSRDQALDLDVPFRELKQALVREFERQYLEALLRANQGNVAACCRQAGMDRKNLWQLLRKYDIDANDYRPAAAKTTG